MDGITDGTQKVQRFKFRVTALGSYLKAQYDEILDDGRIGGSRVFYNDPEKVVSYGTADGVANVKTRGKRSARLGLRDWSPAFIELAWLQQEVNISGLKALTPAQIGEEARWQSIISALALDKNQKLRVSVNRTDGVTYIDFISPKFDSSVFYPVRSEFRDTHGALIRQIEIKDVAKDQILGVRPTIVNVSTFWPSGEDEHSVLAAEWNFKIEKFILNPTVDESDLIFDPVSADKIYDADNRVWIEVPK